MLAVLLSGLKIFLKNPTVLGLIGVFGGLVLIWMGWDILRETSGEVVTGGEGSTSLQPFAAGVLATISNPYWVIWWVSIGAALLLSSTKLGVLGISIFFIGHILADLLWYSSLTLAISKGTNLLKPRIYRIIILLCSISLFSLGGYFLYRGSVDLLTLL